MREQKRISLNTKQRQSIPDGDNVCLALAATIYVYIWAKETMRATPMISVTYI